MKKGAIYLAGVSYSGKTQLRLMLSNHPNIIITRRTYMWQGFYNRYGVLSDPDNFDRCLASMLASKHIQKLDPDPQLISREFWQGQPGYARLFTLIHQHHATQQGKTRWGNQHKSVENDVDLIFATDPSAVVIHMIRHPFARVEESVFQSSYRKGKVGLETFMWRKSSQMALRNLKKYPQRYLVIQCEHLFSYPEKTLRDVCTFLGEDFHPEMLEIESLLEIDAAVSGSTAIVGLTSERKTGEFPTGLTPTEQLFVQSRTRNEMAAFGYRKNFKRPSFLNLLKYALVDYPLNLVGATLWETRRRKKMESPNNLLEHGS
jgi:hypothetical protein